MRGRPHDTHGTNSVAAFNCSAFIANLEQRPLLLLLLLQHGRQRWRRRRRRTRGVTTPLSSPPPPPPAEHRKKFRERPGELTPRNLDPPVPGGFVDVGGRRALIYGNPPWHGLLLTPCSCSPPHWLQEKQAAASGPGELRRLSSDAVCAALGGHVYLTPTRIEAAKKKMFE